MSAISGIEMALWDIAGQALGCPIWQLLGRFRDQVRVYNDCNAGEEENPQSYARKAKEVEARGFSAIKFDIDPLPDRRDPYNRCISNDHIHHFVEVVTAIREALDSNTDLAIDAHWAYAPVDIIKVAQAFETCSGRRSRARRKRRSYEKGEGGIAHANLHWRKLLYALWVPRTYPHAGGRYRIARHG